MDEVTAKLDSMAKIGLVAAEDRPDGRVFSLTKEGVAALGKL
jgi:hypothetical protein